MRLAGLLRLGGSSTSSGRNGGKPARERIRTILGLLLVVDGLLVLMVLWPPGPSLQARQNELQRLRAEHETARTVVDQMRDLKIKLQDAIQNRQQFSLQNLMLREGAFSVMLEDLERLATQNRLETAGINYALQEERDQDLVQVETTLTVVGEYSDLVQFINRLEQSQLFWIIDSLNVSGTISRELRLTLRMETYFVPS